jgi:2-(1,2-epoxy-1,2-dihydrophenyl)acetyl-CoA isomerase
VTALDTGSEDLLAEVDEGVAVITMNRPSRRNAFSDEMVQALGRVLAEVEVSDAVGCVVLTGAGGAFSAGGDVKAADLQAGRRYQWTWRSTASG